MKRKLFEKIVMPVALLSLSSCGVDTRGWPTINLGIDPEDVLLYSAHYTCTYPAYVSERKVTYRLEAIQRNMTRVQNIPFKEESMDFDKDKNCTDFLEITITTKYENRIIKCVGYGIANGAICFENDEWHYLPGDFVGFLYTDFYY